MPDRPHYHLEIDTRGKPPVVEITREGSATYVWFNRGAKFVRTVPVSTWPVVNIDVGEGDVVIGIEAVGLQEFTINHVLHVAGLSAPDSLLAKTRYVHADTAAAV